MSVAVMGAVFKISLPPSEKVVALALADHAHDDGTEARPGLDSLAIKCTLSRRQVQRVVHSLVAKGILVVQRPATPTTPVCYRFDLDENGALLGGDNLSRGDNLSEAGVTPVTRGGDTHVTQTVIEPSLEPSSSLVTARADDRPTLESMFVELWALYPRKIKKAETLKRFRVRIREGTPFEELKEAVENYAALRAGQDEQYTMHPTTFFGPEVWRDYLSGGPGLTAQAPTPRQRDSDVSAALEALKGYFLASPENRVVPDDPLLARLFKQFTPVKLSRMSNDDIRMVLTALATDSRR